MSTAIISSTINTAPYSVEKITDLIHQAKNFAKIASQTFKPQFNFFIVQCLWKSGLDFIGQHAVIASTTQKKESEEEWMERIFKKIETHVRNGTLEKALEHTMHKLEQTITKSINTLTSLAKEHTKQDTMRQFKELFPLQFFFF